MTDKQNKKPKSNTIIKENASLDESEQRSVDDLDLNEKAFYNQIASICTRSNVTIGELRDKFQKIIAFNKEQIKKGNLSFTANVERTQKLEDLQRILNSMDNAAKGISAILDTIRQIPSLGKIAEMATSIGRGMGMGSSSTQEEENNNN